MVQNYNKQNPARYLSMLILYISILSIPFITTGCGATAQRQLVFDKGPVSQALAVDVDSFRGNVTIVVDPDATGVLVEANLRAAHKFPYRYRNFLKKREFKETLDDMDVTAKIETNDQGLSVVRVLTTTQFQYPELQWVDLTITLPQVDGIQVRTCDGDVELVDVRGAVTVDNHNGNILLRTLQPMLDPVNLSTTNGNINYRIRAESTGAFDLEAIGGEAQMRAYKGDINIKQRGKSQLYATLNNGKNPVVLKTTNSRIKVVIASNPMGVGYFKF